MLVAACVIMLFVLIGVSEYRASVRATNQEEAGWRMMWAIAWWVLALAGVLQYRGRG